MIVLKNILNCPHALTLDLKKWKTSFLEQGSMGTTLYHFAIGKDDRDKAVNYCGIRRESKRMQVGCPHLLFKFASSHTTDH